MHSQTSLICCSNCFDHHHHHHAQPIILELPAPFSDTMYSHYAIPLHPYKLTVNFNERTRIGHKNCGTKCPRTLPLHTLHLLPWIATDGPLRRQLCYPTTSDTLYRTIKCLCNTKVTGLSWLLRLYKWMGVSKKKTTIPITAPYIFPNTGIMTITPWQTFKNIKPLHIPCVITGYSPHVTLQKKCRMLHTFYRQRHWNARNVHTISDGMWHHVPLDVFPNVSKKYVASISKIQSIVPGTRVSLHNSVNEVGTPSYILHLKTFLHKNNSGISPNK